MPRKTRIDAADALHHVIIRGIVTVTLGLGQKAKTHRGSAPDAGKSQGEFRERFTNPAFLFTRAGDHSVIRREEV